MTNTGVLLKVQEVAAFLNLPPKSVYNLVERGDLVPIKMGRRVRIQPSDLEAFIAAHRQGGAK